MRSRVLVLVAVLAVWWLAAVPAYGAPPADGSTQVGVVVQARPGPGDNPASYEDAPAGWPDDIPRLASTGPAVVQLSSAAVVLLVIGSLLMATVSGVRNTRPSPRSRDRQ